MAERALRGIQRLIGQVEMEDGRRRGVVAFGHQQQLLLDSGRIFMILGALVLMHETTARATAPRHSEEHVFIAFLLWLLGTALAMLSLVTRRFPRLTFIAAAVAMALRNYLLAGL